VPAHPPSGTNVSGPAPRRGPAKPKNIKKGLLFYGNPFSLLVLLFFAPLFSLHEEKKAAKRL
jgi:hypothetical protein